MILYHGSTDLVDKPEIRESDVYLDFGVGFYLTPDKNVATRQAERKFEQYGEGQAKVYKYTIDDNCLKELKVLQFDGYSLELKAVRKQFSTE